MKDASGDKLRSALGRAWRALLGGSARLLRTFGPNTVAHLVLAIALLLGAWFRIDAVARRYPPTEDSPHDVQRYYVSTAQSLLAGRGFETSYESNFIPPPLQALYIAGVKLLLPAADFATMRAGQALISIATLALVYRLGTLMSGPMLGACSALLVALDPDVIGLVATLLAETNFFLLLFAFLSALLVALERRAPTWFMGSGALLGLTSLAKPFPMMLAFVVPAWIVLRGRDRDAWIRAAVFFAGFALIVAPWTTRNALRYGGFYPISTNSGLLLAQSNFAGLDPTRADMIYWDDVRLLPEWCDPAIEAEYAAQRDADGKLEWNLRDRDYARHAQRFILRHPGQFLRSYAVKLRNVFWYPGPYAGYEPLRYSALGERWPFPTFRQVLVLLGLPGVVWFAIATRKSSRSIMVLVFGYFAFFAALLHITRDGRINLPPRLLLTLFAAYFVLQVVNALTLRLTKLYRTRFG
jgi:4-amino-4-deoxy-L-arabinose transferase-like glycosyltransferase